MDTVEALRAIVGETGVLSAAEIATRSAGFLRPDTLKARALVRPKRYRRGFENRPLVP